MRPEVLNPLFAPVTILPEVGPVLARRLERLGITRVRDLLFHLPTGFLRTRLADRLADVTPGERASLAVTVVGRTPAQGRAPARLEVVDTQGQPLSLAFFGPQADRLAGRHGVGTRLRVTGTVELFQGRPRMVHPDTAPPQAPVPTVEPVHPLTEGLSRRQMARLVGHALERVPRLPEWIEPAQRQRQGWPDFAQALRRVHADPDAQAARDRLAYDELLAGQLAWALVRRQARQRRGRPIVGDGRILAAVRTRLPFTLTAAQERALAEILNDLAGEAAMLRLLQGDVGSGKTLVAALAMAATVEAGAQAALLAPTELLARQHRATLEALFQGTPVRVGCLTGREAGRPFLLRAVAEGGIDVLVGTHAIFQDSVVYRDLGLVVIDEQHRFGVAQRLMLQRKAWVPPHVLVMTATPIPRTLALARFGHTAVSVLDEKPPGRTPVDTRIIALGRLEEVVAGVGRHLARGHQAYWVCPALDRETEGLAEPAVRRAEMLRARWPGRVELVHGRMAAAQREAAMDRFRRGEARVLVATTVIEVGVDVPAASLMVVEQAERFGLAQLHQLRGRVGRGGGPATCLLLVGDHPGEIARERLALLRATDDGFAIAEADLRLRGPGELLGTRQAGEPAFRLASDVQVHRWIGAAEADARLLIERDGGLDGPRGEAARVLLHLFEKDAAVRTLRSG